MVLRKTQPVRPFYFRSEETLTDLNANLPLDLHQLEDLIHRVHKRYPLLDKVDLSLTIKGILETMRELLTAGKALSFYELATEIKLLFAWKGSNPQARIRLATAPGLQLKKEDA